MKLANRTFDRTMCEVYIMEMLGILLQIEQEWMKHASKL